VTAFLAIRLGHDARGRVGRHGPSRRRLGVRTMIIDFGSVKGRIGVD